MNRVLVIFFFTSMLAACSESDVRSGFDESQPFAPDTIRFSIELHNDLQAPQTIDYCKVWLYDSNDEFIRLEKGLITVNGVPLSRYDQSQAWQGHTTHYIGRDIPVGAGDITIHLALAGQNPGVLAVFRQPPEVALGNIRWPEKILDDQPLEVSWEGIRPLDQLVVSEYSLITDSGAIGGSLLPIEIRSKGSMDIRVPIMRVQKRSADVRESKPEPSTLRYAKIEFGTYLQGEINHGTEKSKASMHLYTDREVRR